MTDLKCPRCNSTDLRSKGKYVRKDGSVVKRFYCKSCKKYFSITEENLPKTEQNSNNNNDKKYITIKVNDKYATFSRNSKDEIIDFFKRCATEMEIGKFYIIVDNKEYHSPDTFINDIESFPDTIEAIIRRYDIWG